MRFYSLFGMLNIVLCFLILGCAAVEWQHKHPSLKSGDPCALINEDDLQANDITSTIKGFCDNRSNCPDQLSTPVMKDYSTKEAVFKTIYTVSPYGLMTLPFADFTGRTIAVPPGELGIVVHRKYGKVLKKEKVISVERHSGTVTKSWSCLNKDIHLKDTSKNITFQASNLTLLSKLDDSSLYRVTYESCEWDDEFWATLDAGKKYAFKLSSNQLITPEGDVIELGPVRIPDGIDPAIDYEIVNEEGWCFGRDFEVDENCMFAIKNTDGKITINTVMENSETLDGSAD